MKTQTLALLQHRMPLPPLPLAEALVRNVVMLHLYNMDRRARHWYDGKHWHRVEDGNGQAAVQHLYKALVKLPDYWWKYTGSEALLCLLDITKGDGK